MQEKQNYQPANTHGEPQLPAGLHRVLVLPVYGGRVADTQAALALDEALLGALQKQARFEVVSLSREDSQRRFNSPEFSSTEILPRGFLEQLAQAYGADAVLFIDVTVYKPYTPISIGFRAKLATVNEVRLIWTFDDIFSSTDTAVVNSVKRYHRKEGTSRLPTDMAIGTLQSPRRFAAYAADTMFATLPPR